MYKCDEYQSKRAQIVERLLRFSDRKQLSIVPKRRFTELAQRVPKPAYPAFNGLDDDEGAA